jgi:hypothetical protein
VFLQGLVATTAKSVVSTAITFAAYEVRIFNGTQRLRGERTVGILRKTCTYL